MADDNPIIHGIRGKDFASLIINLLKRGKLKKEYIVKILKDGGLEEYEKVFTSKKADENNNYEFYEFLGDLIANTTILWWMARKFPELRKASAVRILARMKITYGSKKVFSVISEKQLGFWDFITARQDERDTQKKSLLEDVLEGFLGLTNELIDSKIHMGAGYAICYNIIESLLDENMKLPIGKQFVEIALEQSVLEDPITIIKQDIEDYFRPGKIIYECPERQEDELLTTCKLIIEREGKKYEIAEAKGSKKVTAKENVARESIKILYKIGFKKNIPEIYRKVGNIKDNPIVLTCIYRPVEIQNTEKYFFVFKIENQDNNNKSCIGILTKDAIKENQNTKSISALIFFLAGYTNMTGNIEFTGLKDFHNCDILPVQPSELENRNTKDFTYNKVFQQNLLRFLNTYSPKDLNAFKSLLKESIQNID